MNERDRYFILADVKDYVQTIGVRRFIQDLNREYPEVWKQIKNNMDVDKQMVLFDAPTDRRSAT